MELRSKRAPQLDFSIGHVLNSGANHCTRPNPIQMAWIAITILLVGDIAGAVQGILHRECVFNDPGRPVYC